jgi:hypothetical protein
MHVHLASRIYLDTNADTSAHLVELPSWQTHVLMEHTCTVSTQTGKNTGSAPPKTSITLDVIIIIMLPIKP